MSSKRVSEKKMGMSGGGAQAASARKPTASRRITRSAPVETPEAPASEPAAAAPTAVAPVLGAAPVLGVAPDAAKPPQDAVAALAYSYWVARNFQGGSPDEDWLRAEQELRAACATA